MATEAAFVDTSSCILEIVEVHSNVLVDLLVMLAVMFNAVAPSSALEGFVLTKDAQQSSEGYPTKVD